MGSARGMASGTIPSGGSFVWPSRIEREAGGVSTESLAATLQNALEKGQTAKAREVLTQILQRPQIDLDLLLRIGIGLAQQELYPEAAQVFARCVKDYPALFEGHYNLALAQFARHQLPEALQAVQDAPRGSEQQELARLYLRGKIQDALGRTAEAERDLSAAFSSMPNQENYALDLGLFYIRQRAYPRAVEVLQRGSSLNPRSSFLLLGLSLAQFLGGRAAQSLETCRKLLALEPDFSLARLLMAFALYIDGKFEEAREVAAAGLTVRNPNPYLYYLHATVLQKLQSKEYNRMLDELALAARGIPACSLCYLTQSKVHQAQGNSQEAITDLETALNLDPRFSEAWYRLAPLYERVGRTSDAARARARFGKLKVEKLSRDTELLRNLFLEMLGGPEPAAPQH